MLRRRAALPLRQGGRLNDHEAVGVGTGVLSAGSPQATRTAKLFITLSLFVILMNPDLQEMLIMDSLAFVTVGAIVIIKAVNKLGYRSVSQRAVAGRGC